MKVGGVWGVRGLSGGSRRGRGPRGSAAGRREAPHTGTCRPGTSEHRDEGTCCLLGREKTGRSILNCGPGSEKASRGGAPGA